MAAGRGAKVGIVLVVLFMILGGLLFVADRVAAGAAEDRIAQETKKALVANKAAFVGDPQVSVSGFPFLTQVLDGVYKKITIDLEQPELNNVKLDDLRIEANSVRADARSLMNGTGTVVADDVEGTATISWQNVRPLLELAGLPSAIDPAQVDLKVVDNRIELRFPLAAQGFNFTLIARGVMVVEAGKVRLKLEEVTSDQGDPPAVVKNLINQNKSRLQVTFRLPGLPYSLVINKVESSDTGILVIASAKNVELTG